MCIVMNLTDKLHLIKVEDKNISNTIFCGHDYPQTAECGICVLLGQNYLNISEPCYILDYVGSSSRRILGAHCPADKLQANDRPCFKIRDGECLRTNTHG